jgi:histidinol phosphatase-like PHP family hydrolase
MTDKHGDIPIIDSHIHTELAYCGRTVSAASDVEISRRAGLAGLFLVEHAPQLYMAADDFWQGRHVSDPQVWRKPQVRRMAEFRALVEPFRGDFVGVGLEVEADCEGQITLHDEDREGIDILVGAIHWVGPDWKTLSEPKMCELFMTRSRQLLEGGVDVLAHPWRWFSGKMPRPTELYAELADMLAAHNTAAEINCHRGEPDPAFFAMCIERGVKVALASDAHEVEEVGQFHKHLAVLRAAAGRDDVADLLAFTSVG